MNADDILFSPIGVADWRTRCREIADYIGQQKYAPNRKKLTSSAPAGALLLEELCRLYHEEQQDLFWLLWVPSNGNSPIQCREIFFDGGLIFARYEDGFSPRLGTVTGGSIRDLNLVRNQYTDHYVFATRQEADAYWKDIDG